MIVYWKLKKMPNITNDFEEDLSNLSYSCPNITEDEIDFLYFSNWFLNGIIQLIICLPGNKFY